TAAAAAAWSMRAKTVKSRFLSAARSRSMVSATEWRLATETSPSCAMAVSVRRLIFPLPIGEKESELARLLMLRQRHAEGFEQSAIHRIVLRVVFGMPLHAERKACRLGHADRLDGAVVGHAFDHDAFAGLEDALAMQRIDPDAFGAK